MKKIVWPLLPILLLFTCAELLQAQVKKVEAIGMTVKDLRRSVAFYRDVLGFSLVDQWEAFGEEYENEKNLFGIRFKTARLKLGKEMIELTDYLTAGGRQIAEDARSNDLSFQHIAIVVADMDRAFKRLRKHNVEYVSTGPQTIPASNSAAAGIKAFYFHDPDGHALELIYFPRDKGDPKWQHPDGKLFLGIDHTAISVSNSKVSLEFYEGMLGIPKKGESWNSGEEQEHLNAVKGARLHITGLRTASGPGIEFLEYLAPGPGRLLPADSKPNDLWHWETTVIVEDAQKLYTDFKKQGLPIISREAVHLKNQAGKEFTAFLVRDPDGHAVRIVDRDR